MSPRKKLAVILGLAAISWTMVFILCWLISELIN